MGSWQATWPGPTWHEDRLVHWCTRVPSVHKESYFKLYLQCTRIYDVPLFSPPLTLSLLPGYNLVHYGGYKWWPLVQKLALHQVKVPQTKVTSGKSMSEPTPSLSQTLGYHLVDYSGYKRWPWHHLIRFKTALGQSYGSIWILEGLSPSSWGPAPDEGTTPLSLTTPWLQSGPQRWLQMITLIPFNSV